ncbi:MAG: sulfatase-like hydrolase/transferase [Undibacterium sp.]|nr:sulfatase-like hydrolase/transferase [Opitutaceae bacterium]
MKRSLWFVALCLLCSAAAAKSKTRHVFLVTIDGLRWQEVFRGADATLMTADKMGGGGVPNGDLVALRTDFLADTPEERRKKLMPFFRGVAVPAGQAFGNRDAGSAASVLNAERVSYPGYNELLTGAAGPLITSNAPVPNRNVTVLESLNGRPAFAGRVAAAGAWNVFAPILNVGRSRLPLFVTLQHSAPGSVSSRIAELERLMDDIPPITNAESFDAFAYYAAVDRCDTRPPRVFPLGLGEPDEWAHARRYDRYLYSIQRCDRFIRQLWEKTQAKPEYRDTTSIVLTSDHGRGVTPEDWTSHGEKVARSEKTWIAVIGPDTRAWGERKNAPVVHQAQVAATVAALLGEDFVAAFPAAAAPLGNVLPAG